MEESSKRIWKLVAVLASLSMSFGCVMASLSAQGGKVEMIQRMDRADCKNLGPIFGKGGGSFGGGWIPDEKLMEFATNDLRNKAAKMGATHVVFSTHQMGQTGGQYGSTTSTATLSGVAYRCPDKATPPPNATPTASPEQLEDTAAQSF